MSVEVSVNKTVNRLEKKPDSTISCAQSAFFFFAPHKLTTIELPCRRGQNAQ